MLVFMPALFIARRGKKERWHFLSHHHHPNKQQKSHRQEKGKKARGKEGGGEGEGSTERQENAEREELCGPAWEEKNGKVPMHARMSPGSITMAR